MHPIFFEMSSNDGLHLSRQCNFNTRNTFAAQTTASQGAGASAWRTDGATAPTTMLPHSSELLASQEHRLEGDFSKLWSKTRGD